MKTTNLIAVAFAIGYFGSEFLPTIANVATVDTAAAGRMIAAFGLAQVVGLLFFGFLADRAKPLLPVKIAAGLFLLAAIVGATMTPTGLLLERLVSGAGAGVIGSLFRTVGRMRQSRGSIIWATIVGGAIGLVVPIIGWQITGDPLGRAVGNLLVALIVCFLCARLPRLGQTRHYHQEPWATVSVWQALTKPSVLVLSITSFFSAGAYSVFFLVVSKEIIPRLDVDKTVVWLATAAVWIVGALLGSLLTKKKHNTSPTVGLTLALTLTGLIYILPTPLRLSAAALILTILALTVSVALIDKYWADLVSQAADPRHEGMTFSLSLIVASSGRFVWPFVIGGAIGTWIDWRQALLIIFLATEACAATIFLTTRNSSKNGADT